MNIKWDKCTNVYGVRSTCHDSYINKTIPNQLNWIQYGNGLECGTVVHGTFIENIFYFDDNEGKETTIILFLS